MDYVIIRTFNICEKSVIKNCTIYWIPKGYNIPIIKLPYSQQYINYCCRNSLLNCCTLCLQNSAISFLHKVIVHKPVFIHFQTKDRLSYWHRFFWWQVLFFMEDLMQTSMFAWMCTIFLIWLLVMQSDIQKLVTYAIGYTSEKLSYVAIHFTVCHLVDSE